MWDWEQGEGEGERRERRGRKRRGERRESHVQDLVEGLDNRRILCDDFLILRIARHD